ncbi:MAG: phytoene/squalene synthase family protein [Candidatus Zixiibacteriota bacterium]
MTEIDFARELDFSEVLTNPILDIAARCWDRERYEAFKICYRSMRIIDDLVDSRKATGITVSARECKDYIKVLSDWLESLKRRLPSDTFQQELVATIEKFRIPLWPWEKLVSAMIYDLTHEGFPTFRDFLRYCEGAAVAPASVFMHLCGANKKNGVYFPPDFDSRNTARPLALFSYLVHILRDFQQDQKNHLNYFADDICKRHGLTAERLREIAEKGEISQPFRDMIARYLKFAESYRQKARRTISQAVVHLKSRYRLSLEIIYHLYHQIFERIDPQTGKFTARELTPTPEEIRERIDRTIASFQSA